MRRLLLLVIGGLLWATVPAANAIETASFGLAPAGGRTRTALHEDVAPGGRSRDAVRVWNKTNEPLTLTVSVQRASLDADGKVELGGAGGAAAWVRVERTELSLGPRESVEVGVLVHAPRELPDGTSTAAIVVAPAASSSAESAVVQRVALMVYVQAPEGSGLRAALPWFAWAALALLGVVASLVLRRTLVSGRGR